MSKILAIFFIILISQFNFFIGNAQAFLGINETAACTSPSVKIGYKNPANGSSNQRTFFPENSGDITLAFSIINANTFNVLKGKELRLKVFGDWVNISLVGVPDYYTAPITITDSDFQFTIPSSQPQAERGSQEGVLQWKPDNNGAFQEFCSQIKYQIGSVGGSCTILANPPVPSEILPNTPLTISFFGIQNKKYQLNKSATKLAETTTDSQGIGIFRDIVIPGNTGELVRLVIYSPGSNEQSQCEKSVTIKSTASPQPSFNPSASIYPLPVPSFKACDPKTDPTCSLGGGIQCGDKDHPGIVTAIGCIRTNPSEFAQDLLKFVLGIGGGIAFLMMLLGAFQMLTSAGNPDTLRAGRERLTSAVIGLLIVIFAILLLQIIGWDILQLPGFGRKI